jgi:sulfite reductase beta subunit-like hemoprotein
MPFWNRSGPKSGVNYDIEPDMIEGGSFSADSDLSASEMDFIARCACINGHSSKAEVMALVKEAESFGTGHIRAAARSALQRWKNGDA